MNGQVEVYEAVKDVLIPVASILFSIVVAYLTAIWTIRQEYRHGRLRMLELVRRYFLNVLGAFDEHTNQIRSDPTAKKMYVAELEAILKELGDLVAHPYFSVLIARYPLLSKLIVQTRRELIEHDLKPTFALNHGTLNEFSHIHMILKKELPKILNSPIDDTIVKLAKGLNDESGK